MQLSSVVIIGVGTGRGLGYGTDGFQADAWPSDGLPGDFGVEVSFPFAVCTSYPKGKRGKQGLLMRAYAACVLADRTPKQVETLYRKRSAIETAFRTAGGGRARTTSESNTATVISAGQYLVRNLWLMIR